MAKSRQGCQRSFLVDFHQAAIACDIGGKNGDEFSLEGRRFHAIFLIHPPGDSEKTLPLCESRVFGL
jgi:hypothetical protein